MRLPMMTNVLSSTLGDSIASLRSRIATTSKEAVTGRYSDLTKHLNGKIGAAMLGQKAVEDIAEARSRLNLRQTRLEMTQVSLSLIQEASSGLGTRLQSALGFEDNNSVSLVARDAQAALEQVFSSLTVRHGERYIFAGDATSTLPFGDPDQLIADVRDIATNSADAAAFSAGLDTYFNDPAGPWQQTIYSGTLATSDPDAVTGIDPAITELVTGLASLALANPGSTPAIMDADAGVLELVARRLSSGETALINLRADRGVVQEVIARQLDSLNIEETVLTQAFNDLTARDQYDAASELRELESSLEASYLLTSRISNLSLLNYLR